MARAKAQTGTEYLGFGMHVVMSKDAPRCETELS